MLTRLPPALFTAGVTVLAMALPVRPAGADTTDFLATTDCVDGECHVAAHQPGQGAAPASGNPEGAGEGSAGQASGPSCVTPDVEFAQSGKEGPHQVPLGTALCEGTGDVAGAQVFDPAVLAEQARAVMRLPDPAIGTAPAPDEPRFVNLPSWMWVDAGDWAPVSVTASVSAGSVTVVATPERVVWDTGDGNEVVCTGSGTVFSRATAGESGSPDCGHTYTALPPGGAGATVDVTAVWEWGVTWSTTDGRGGDLEELTTSSSVTVPVSEIQSVVTHIR